jgi:hypothetical protein
MLTDTGYASLVIPVLVALPVWFWLRKRSKRALPYPSGPNEYPLIGNMLDFPFRGPLWEGLTDLAKRHGSVLPSRRLSGLKH